MDERKNIIGPKPAKPTDTLQIGNNFYIIKQIEPLYFYFDNDGDLFLNQDYSVDDLVPSKELIYYITGIGIQGNLLAQIKYPAGKPRNTVVGKPTQKLDNVIAPKDQPFPMKFAIISGDKLELSIDIDGGGSSAYGKIWFYGWRIEQYSSNKKPTKVIFLEDVRSFG